MVVINIHDRYTAITMPLDAVTAYERYIGQEAKLTPEEYMDLLKQDGRVVFESEETGRKVTIKRIGDI